MINTLIEFYLFKAQIATNPTEIENYIKAAERLSNNNKPVNNQKS